MSRTTIVLAEDHHIVRQGLHALLESKPSFAIVGEASDGLEAIDIVERLQPDIILLDMVMPGLGGAEVTKRIRKCSPNTRVVMLSMYDNEAYVVEALRAGAMAYVLKGCVSDELVHAIDEAAAGRYYIAAALPKLFLADHVRTRKDNEDLADPYEGLTPREREVLNLAAHGCNNVQISSRLCISRRTVEIHRANVMHKLGLRSQTDIVRYAIRRGILPKD